MAKRYFERLPEDRLLAGTTARAADVEAVFDEIGAAFDLLPVQRDDLQKGFGERIAIPEAMVGDHAVPLAQAREVVASEGVEEAPANDLAHARRNRTWVDPRDHIDFIEEAPKDGQEYLRRAGGWLSMQDYLAGMAVDVSLTIDDDSDQWEE